MRIRHCVECSSCRTRYLVSLSPYRNGSYLIPTLRGCLEEFALYCSCSKAAPPSLWRWNEVWTCDVSNVAYDRGYGTAEEITAINDCPGESWSLDVSTYLNHLNPPGKRRKQR